ncbi:MAG: hypothetical protein ACFFHD_03655 [Promethearchaeota archaeon]
MRNKILYIYTENLNFFYRLNKELKRLGINFTILNTRAKIPDNKAIILTTSKEIKLFRNSYKNLRFLPYSLNQNFKSYILRVLAAYRIGYKDNYTKLTFSVDPGSKYIGIVVFLDNYFLVSHTIYEKENFFRIIMNVVKSFKNNNAYPMELEFKLGSGVLPITIELVKKLYQIFKNEKFIKIYLVDESKSSKLKIREKRRITKHEISALLLALRTGIEVNESNYFKTFKQIRGEHSSNREKNEMDPIELNNTRLELKELLKKILNNKISLIDSCEFFNRSKKHLNYI